MSGKKETQNYVGSSKESSIRFDFRREFLRFDKEVFYTSCCSGLKGIDFLVVDGERLVFLEVKNFHGYEDEYRWRTVPDNNGLKDRKRPPKPKDVSLDVEMIGKVSGTLTALQGAQTFDKTELLPLHDNFRAWCERTNIFLEPASTEKPRLSVVLLLEGAPESESNKTGMILQRLEKSLKNKLKWLNCLVYVVDLNGAAERPAISRLFDATLLPNA